MFLKQKYNRIKKLGKQFLETFNTNKTNKWLKKINSQEIISNYFRTQVNIMIHFIFIKMKP